MRFSLIFPWHYQLPNTTLWLVVLKINGRLASTFNIQFTVRFVTNHDYNHRFLYTELQFLFWYYLRHWHLKADKFLLHNLTLHFFQYFQLNETRFPHKKKHKRGHQLIQSMPRFPFLEILFFFLNRKEFIKKIQCEVM